MISGPLRLPCGAIIPNRLAKAAMTERISSDGNANEQQRQLYKLWAQTGTGLLITGNIMVDRKHLESAGNVVADEHTDQESLRAWTDASKVTGNHIWAQISHSGRQTNRFVNKKPKAPSAVQLHKMGIHFTVHGVPKGQMLENIKEPR